jgi:hypothetical protein
LIFVSPFQKVIFPASLRNIEKVCHYTKLLSTVKIGFEMILEENSQNQGCAIFKARRPPGKEKNGQQN